MTDARSLVADPFKPSNEDLFQRERGAIFSSAIGLARLALKSGEPEKALCYLDKAVDEVDAAWREALLADGYAEPLIEQFLGPRKPVAE